MIKINCELCGIEIEKKTNNQKFCKECSKLKQKEKSREWRNKNISCIKKYREKYKEYNKEYGKKYYQENKEYYKEYNSKYSQENRKRIRQKNKNDKKKKKYLKNKRKTNKNFNIAGRLRTQVWYALKIYTKTGKIMTSKKYGIDWGKVIEHLKPFPEDLENYEIHHIKPIHTFNFVNKDGSTDLKEVSKAFSPKNHKWLTIEEHKEIHKS